MCVVSERREDDVTGSPRADYAATAEFVGRPRRSNPSGPAEQGRQVLRGLVSKLCIAKDFDRIRSQLHSSLVRGPSHVVLVEESEYREGFLEAWQYRRVHLL